MSEIDDFGGDDHLITNQLQKFEGLAYPGLVVNQVKMLRMIGSVYSVDPVSMTRSVSNNIAAHCFNISLCAFNFHNTDDQMVSIL